MEKVKPSGDDMENIMPYGIQRLQTLMVELMKECWNMVVECFIDDYSTNIIGFCLNYQIFFL